MREPPTAGTIHISCPSKDPLKTDLPGSLSMSKVVVVASATDSKRSQHLPNSDTPRNPAGMYWISSLVGVSYSWYLSWLNCPWDHRAPQKSDADLLVLSFHRSSFDSRFNFNYLTCMTFGHVAEFSAFSTVQERFVSWFSDFHVTVMRPSFRLRAIVKDFRCPVPRLSLFGIRNGRWRRKSKEWFSPTIHDKGRKHWIFAHDSLEVLYFTANLALEDDMEIRLVSVGLNTH